MPFILPAGGAQQSDDSVHCAREGGSELVMLARGKRGRRPAPPPGGRCAASPGNTGSLPVVVQSTVGAGLTGSRCGARRTTSIEIACNAPGAILSMAFTKPAACAANGAEKAMTRPPGPASGM